jgi:hypothetical protein
MPASRTKKGKRGKRGKNEGNKKRKKNPAKIIIGVNIEKTELAKIRLLAQGWDRSVSWVIRELIDASMLQHEQDIADFKEQFAEEDAANADNTSPTHQDTATDAVHDDVTDTPSLPQDNVTTNTSPKQPVYFPPRDEDPSTADEVAQ